MTTDIRLKVLICGLQQQVPSGHLQRKICLISQDLRHFRLKIQPWKVTAQQSFVRTMTVCTMGDTTDNGSTFANNHFGSKQISVLVLPSNHNKISFFITKETTHHCRDRLRVIQNGNKPLKIIFIRRFDAFHIQNGK